MTIRILPLDRHRYAPLVQSWLAHPASAFWQMGSLSVDDVRAYLAAVAADPRQDSWLGFVDDEPTFLVETYDPTTVLLDGVPEVQPGDLGMHLLVAPPGGAPVHGLTSDVMAATVAFCFDELAAARVVVEPDVRNARVAAKNAEVGFRVQRELDLPGKRASLALCTREAFAASGGRLRADGVTAPTTAGSRR
ncbi:GNAT family N-acetyltransferase [Cellulomonas xylanilytica]|uniref:Lysine N-acyltransferase MbtK n=1 Tax=Cellulomonas xylanilytica TaxID=233583 RepID=A0A510VEC9_9CELL|nr:GNAT family N-acetyltransferase [Cellulomonas xylanilytica]GEK23540.1 acetyltransferase [Cellulomonas xylanilytica]